MPRFTQRTIREERSSHQRRELGLAIGRILANPIINVLLFMTCLVVMSNHVHASITGAPGHHDRFIAVALVGMFYTLVRLLVRPVTRQPLYQGLTVINGRGW